MALGRLCSVIEETGQSLEAPDHLIQHDHTERHQLEGLTTREIGLLKAERLNITTKYSILICLVEFEGQLKLHSSETY